ncbi:MAG: Lamin Tail Domain, partial [Bacteroidota bacterium]
MELRISDSLVATSPRKHSSSSLKMVLIVKRDSQSISAQFVSEGLIIDSLNMSVSPLLTDTLFIRIGQSGQSAVGAHELLGFYRGPALDWGWNSTGVTHKLAFTELSLSSAFFGEEPFVELLNTGKQVVNLMGCSLSDPKSKKTAPKSTRLEPGERICLSSGRPATPIFHQQWAQLPHLNQAGDTLYLTNSKGEILARTHYRPEHWGPYDPDWGYTLEKSCEKWACLDEQNWVSSSLPGGSPGYAHTGPCRIDSSLLFNRLPLYLVSEQEIWLQQAPHTWGYWDFYQTNQDSHSYHSTGTNRWTRTDTATRITTQWCTGQTSELIQKIQAKSPHLFFTEGFIGPYGLDQSFIELYNPSDSGLSLESYRLEFRETSGALVNLIPLSHLFPAVGAQSIILLAEQPQSLDLPEGSELSLWIQAWPTWPSGYQAFNVYLCSAHLDLDSLPWPPNTLQSGRSLERLNKYSPWQPSGSQEGKSPGVFEIRKPYRDVKPQISNRIISELQPLCEIR